MQMKFNFHSFGIFHENVSKENQRCCGIPIAEIADGCGIIMPIISFGRSGKGLEFSPEGFVGTALEKSFYCKFNQKLAKVKKCAILLYIMGNTRENQRKLLSPEREQLILAALGKGVQTIAELAAELQVSEATVRRDLVHLDSRGLIRRVHGGALPPQSRTDEPYFHEKTTLHAAGKEAIAAAALELIHDGDAIFLDGGSTVLALVRKLSERKNLTILTNSLMAAAELMESPHRLILLGGEFRPRSRTLVGALTQPVAESLYMDIAFLGTIGLCPDGLFTTDPGEAFTKETVIRRAGKVVLLADGSKFGRKSLVRSGRLEDLDAIVTDGNVPDGFLKQLHKLHCKVIRATTKGEQHGE